MISEIDATGYSAGELVSIANIIASHDIVLYPTAEAKARAVIPEVLKLVEEISPLHDCGRQLRVLLHCKVCDNDE